MKKRLIVMILLAAVFIPLLAADGDEEETSVTRVILPTKTDGSWPCVYYLLNSNDELNNIAASQWTGRCIAEDDWAWGYGPFSNSMDQFLVTGWGSNRMPLLVRRHFTLTADDINHISASTFTLTCSYDENPKVYLNGRLIWSAYGWNDNDYGTYRLNVRDKGWLKEGDNVLAVSLMAGNGGGHIDYGLTMTSPSAPSAIRRIDDTQENAATVVFDLQGRRVVQPATGLYIIDKKKKIIK